MDSPPHDPKPRRGGARTGSGRKAKTGDGGPMKLKTVNLDETTIATLTAYGDGELSEGIRRAARVVGVVAVTKGGVMARELKLFRGNWDGRTERAVVCATKKEAMALLGASASHMRDMFNSNELRKPNSESVWAAPGIVFQRPMSSVYDSSDAWVPVVKK